jgi:AraC-like DNA-binding protein
MELFLDIYLLCMELAASNLVMAALLLLTLRKARNSKANIMLAIWLIVLGIAFLNDILYRNKVFNTCPQLLDYDSYLLLLNGPLLYGYILYQTRPHFRLRAKHLLHLLWVVAYGILAWRFFTADKAVKFLSIKDPQWSAFPHYIIAGYLVKFQIIFYIVTCYRLLIQHNRVILDLVSSLENRRLQWLRNLLISSTVIFLVWVLTNELTLSDELMGLVFLGFSYWVAYHALSQEYLFQNVDTQQVANILEDTSDVRYKNSALTNDNMQALKEQITAYMIQSKPYLNSELTLTTLANELQLNPYHLSQVLNEGFGENFYKFVNRYRIEESINLLVDPAFKHYTILAIANEAGFNSKTTFNKTFKEYTGLAPSSYVKSILQ